MEDGNEATIGSGITHSPLGEQNDEKCGYQTDEAENLHGWRPSLGAYLTACRQDNAVASKNLYRRTTAPTCWIAAVSAAEEISRKVRKVRKEIIGGRFVFRRVDVRVDRRRPRLPTEQ